MYRNAYPRILTDEVALTSILRNLLSNGISNHLMSIFGSREDDVAMVAVRRT